MKDLKSFLVITCLLISAFKPSPSKAIGSIEAKDTVAIVLGSIIATGSTVGVISVSSKSHCRSLCIFKVFPYLLFASFGLIILDHQNKSVVFKNLSYDKGKKLGHSQAEILAFNDELDEINQAIDFITMEVIHHHDQSPQALSDLSYRLWQESMDQFSSETQSALTKMTSLALDPEPH